MIGTIGFLVQETSRRGRWLLAVSLYTSACIITSFLLGAALGEGGLFLHQIASPIENTFVKATVFMTGISAIAYAASDAGLVRLPRPYIMYAVPVTWWRKWKPYSAALAYGAALGLGFTTYIQFGAWYILCLWCIIQGNWLYGALLLSIYGSGRALVLFPLSWYTYQYCSDSTKVLHKLSTYLETAKLLVACILILFGVEIIVSMFF